MSKIDSILTRVDLGEDVSSDQATRVALPVGTVTLLMADAEGSTRLWESEPDAMAPATASHDRIVNEAIGRHGGVKPKDQGEGDSFMTAFSRPSDALEAAVEIQSQLLQANSPLKLRMAIHTGEVQLRDESNYIGVAVNRAARLRSIGHGGQILISQVTHDLVADHPPANVSFKELGTHRLKDLTRPEQVFQVMHAELSGDFPPLRSLDALPNNLPAQRSSFIGRDAEIKELARLLAETRLLTLSGSGGAGKTRLGLQLGAELLDEFSEGVWFVPLAAVTADDAVPGQIASVLGVGERETQILPTFIRTKAMLIILDNAEHVINGTSGIVSTLLDACPNLKILVTSREHLAVEGETTYRVPSLSLPVEGSRPPINSLTEYEAIQLFVDRATKARPNFRLDDENAGAVSDICRRLDGVPLAVELAAARVRILSPSQILEGLSDRFRLLTGSSRTAVPRQQTLRASVEWSHELLSEPEQIAFRRLSVFSSAFDLDAAEAVISSDDLPQMLVLEVLTQLFDKSLLVATDEGAATAYSMLETVRHYGLERLSDADEETAVRAKHRAYLRESARRAYEQARRGEGEYALFVDAQAEIESALEWSMAREDWEEAADLFGNGVWGAYSSGRAWITKYFDRLVAELPEGSLARLKVVANVGALASFESHLVPYAEEAIEIIHASEDPEAQKHLPSALWGVALVALSSGNRAKARAAFAELEEAAKAQGQVYWELYGSAGGAQVRVLDGDVENGLAIALGVMERARQLSSWVIGALGFYVGLIHLLADRREEAVSYYLEAIPPMRQQKVRNILFQWALDHVSQILIMSGKSDEARPYVEEGIRYCRDYDLLFGNYWYLVQSMAHLRLEDGQVDEAIALQTEAVDGTRPTGGVLYLQALSQLARILLEHGERARGGQLLEEALILGRDYEVQPGRPGTDPVRQIEVPLAVFAQTSWDEDPSRSARLQGFIDEWCRAHGIRRSVLTSQRRQHLIDQLKRVLPGKRLEAELEAGGGLSTDAAVTYALGGGEDPLVGALLAADNIEGSLRAGRKLEGSISSASARHLSDAGFSVASAIVALARGLQTNDEDELHAALPTLVEMEEEILIAACLEALAEISADQRSFEESARLCGAALALRERAGHASIRCSMASAHEALGADAFDAIVEEGKKLSMQEAVDYAARGRGERKRPSSGWSSLTPTELKVAGLVAEGLSNPQISERLFVSRRTVQTHLYNIFAKVGVSTRAELAAEMVRRKPSATEKGER